MSEENYKLYRKRYLQAMFGEEFSEEKEADKERVKAALEFAHEIRQFEIRLYWHRSLFFWGFVLTLFAGLGLIFTAEKQTTLSDFMSVCIAALGFFTTCAWYYIEKGSKAWQHNWELHIDFLEDDITGKLYKTVLRLDHEDNFFSVSKITKTVIFAFGLFWFLASVVTTLNALLPRKLECFFCSATIFFENSPRLGIAISILLPFLIFIIVCILAHDKKCCLRGHWRTSLETMPENGNYSAKLHLVPRPLPKVPDNKER